MKVGARDGGNRSIKRPVIVFLRLTATAVASALRNAKISA